MAQRMMDNGTKGNKSKSTGALQNVRWTFWSGYSEGCPLNRWLVKNNYYFSSKGQLDQWCSKNNLPSKNPTHLVLNYGIACIPDDKMEEFFTHYSESIPLAEECGTEELEKGNVTYDISRPGLYFTENRTPVFRMFIDMDLKVAAKMGDDIRRKILNILQRAVRQMFQQATPLKNWTAVEYSTYLSEMVILGTPVRVIEDSDGTEQLKYGYHLIFPNLEVTSEIAEIIRRYILYCLLQEDDLKDMNWLDIIDGSVYHGSGLRMPHSFKMEFCKCRNPDRDNEDEDNVSDGKYDPKCFTCFGTGRFPWHNTYTCQSVYKGDGTLDDFKTALYRRDLKSLLHHATIRTSRQTPSNPDPVPPVDQKIITDTLKFAYGEEAIAKSVAAHKVKRHTSIPGEDGHSTSFDSGSSKLLRLDSSDEKYKIIVATIKSLYPELNPKISQITYYENVTYDPDGNEVSRTMPTTYLAREQNGACLNLDLEGKKTHRSSGTYFVVTPTGITQRCFCPKADFTSRTSGKKCSEFESVPRKVNITTTIKTKAKDDEAQEVEETKEFNAYSPTSPLMLKVFPEHIKSITAYSETWDPLRVSKDGVLENIDEKKIDFGVSFLPTYIHSPSSTVNLDDDEYSSSSSRSTPESLGKRKRGPDTPKSITSNKKQKCVITKAKSFVVPFQTFQQQPDYKTMLKKEALLNAVLEKGPIKAHQEREMALQSSRRKSAAGSITVSQRKRNQDKH